MISKVNQILIFVIFSPKALGKYQYEFKLIENTNMDTASQRHGQRP